MDLFVFFRVDKLFEYLRRRSPLNFRATIEKTKEFQSGYDLQNDPDYQFEWQFDFDTAEDDDDIEFMVVIMHCPILTMALISGVHGLLAIVRVLARVWIFGLGYISTKMSSMVLTETITMYCL